MKLGQACKMALHHMLTNRLRSILTMLGIIIGVAAVISIVSLGQGTSSSVADQVSSLGTTNVSVSISGNSSTEQVVGEKDINDWANLSEVKAVSPVVKGTSDLKNGENAQESVSVAGVAEAYQAVKDLSVQSGRFFMAADEGNRSKVAVLGAGTASELFGFENPLGHDVKIDGSVFKVIGVLKEKGEALQGSVDDMALIPLSTAERFYEQTAISSVEVQMASEQAVERGMAKIKQQLYNKFSGDETKFNVRNQSDIGEALTSVSGTMAVFLAGIAGISLLVGGIGIMNIMLVSVTERTREIGIRKAIGAKKRDILAQFLVEAILLSSIGGGIGVLLGLLITEGLAPVLEVSVLISWPAVIISAGFSLVIGVIFGFLPANKAANLNPLAALRHD